MNNGFKVIGGSSSKILTEDVCDILSYNTKKKIKPVKTLLSKFANGESLVEIHENLRGLDVFVVQLFSKSVNDDLMELMLLLDALKRSDVKSINLILPMYPYARQDRKSKSRTPISSRTVASMLEIYNIDRLITIDLHASQIQGFFNLPVDNLYGSILFLPYMKQFTNDITIISPDSGGTQRATYFAKALDCSMSFCYKHRNVNKPGKIEEMRLVGNVEGKDCLIVDDLCDSGGTLIKCANMLKENGAVSVNVFFTHPVLSGNAIDNLTNSKIDGIFTTDTLPLTEELMNNNKFNIISVASLLSDVITRLIEGKSLSKMFEI